MGSIISLRSRTAATGDAQSEFDAASGETVARFQAVVLDEDFLGASHQATIPTTATLGYPWGKKLQGAGTPTVAGVANAAGGVMQLALDATSEKQEATLYAVDQLNWDMTKSAQFESGLALPVLPSLAAVEMVWGFHSAWIDGPDNASFYARFQVLGNGAVNYQTKDGVNTKTFASGVVLTASAFRNFRIDATDPTNVCFFIDNVQVNTPGQMTFAATGASAIMQPIFTIYKASGAGLGTMQIDSVQAAANRS